MLAVAQVFTTSEKQSKATTRRTQAQGQSSGMWGFTYRVACGMRRAGG
ncbi:MAG: hypothetical protein OJF49_002684 [Ktedonobacterales bacterium]|nr:MAG: hypothetical protein OJF49_002684 [Ktedonobacterales bacterium]